MPSHHGKSGTSAGVAQGTSSSGGNGKDYGPYSKGPTHQPSQKTTTRNGKKTTTGDGVNLSSVGIGANILKGNYLTAGLSWGAKKIGNIFADKRTEQQKVEANIKKGYDVLNPSEMRAAETKKTYDWGPQNGGGGNVTTATQSLVTAPTADKAAGFGHQWNFQAYGANTQTAANPYDYTKAPYAKKGKLVRKYATGQEIKNFSKGKRFGPPPLKGPDPQGLQVILENSDYFKKLIG